MRAVLLSRDLMMLSQLQGAANQTGAKLVSAGNAAAALEQLQGDDESRLLIDLTLSDLNLEQLLQSVAELQPPRATIAFGPHVHEARLQAARDAGCNLVLSRGAFCARLAELLQADVGPAR